MKIERTWAMPNANTFRCQPILDFVLRYIGKGIVSIDPFARDFTLCTYTNDINPQTKAQYHMDSVNFLELMVEKSIKADAVIFDPPYSPEQMKRAYDGFGLSMNGRDALRTAGWKKERDLIKDILNLDGIVLSFGWNSCGMGMTRLFEIEEILLVCHGAGHCDTICMAEREIAEQYSLDF